MEKASDKLPATGNVLLDSLPWESRDRLAPRLERLSLAVRHPVYEPGGPIPHVYFPLDSIISLVAVLADREEVEVLTVGREGMAGMPVFWGTVTIPTKAYCQIPGEAYRVSAGVFRSEVDRGGELPGLFLRYTQAAFNQVAWSAACNRVHPIEQRCARWLLMTHDRVGRDDFELKQELLAEMLGVRRAGVSAAAGALQRAGHIRYARGRICVVNRTGLESAACECYRVIRDEYSRLFNNTDHPVE